MPREHNVRSTAIKNWREALSRLEDVCSDPEFSEDEASHVLGALLSQMADDLGFSVSSPEFSGLTCSEGDIAALNQTVAEMYGAQEARCSFSGTSPLLVAAGVTLRKMRPNRNVLICETAFHQSVLGLQILSGFDVQYVENPICPNSGCPLPVADDQLLRVIREHGSSVAGVVVTSPTYEGVGRVPEQALTALSEQGGISIIDAAWGSLCGTHSAFPSSLAGHADIVITSPHKSGLGACQTSVALFRDRKTADCFDGVFDLGLGTTSLNRMLGAIAEFRMLEWISGRWNAQIERCVSVAQEIKRQIKTIDPKLRVLEASREDGYWQMPKHVFIECSQAQVSGLEWAEQLSVSRGLDVELARPNGILLLFGLGCEDAEVLMGALSQSYRACTKNHVSTLPPGKAEFEALSLSNPSRAYFCESECVPLDQATGRTLTQSISLYPPGRPIARVGEICSQNVVERVEHALRINQKVNGLVREGRVQVASQSGSSEASIAVVNHRLTDGLELNVYRSRQAPERFKSHYPDFFRKVFCHWPACEYMYSLDSPTLVLGPSEWLRFRTTQKGDLYDLPTLDAAKALGGFDRVMDPCVTDLVLADRCKDDGYITAVTEIATGRLVGLLHVRFATLARLFQSEEWSNPRLFSKHKHPELLTSPERFFDKARYHFGLEPDDRVMTVSTVAIDPKDWGRPLVFFKMMSTTAACFSKTESELPFLAEVPSEGPAREIDIATNDRLLHGVVETGRDMVFSAHVRSALSHYQSFARFKAALKARGIQKRALYSSSTSDHPDLSVVTTNEKGRSVIATDAIPKGTRLARFEGEKYLAETAMDLPSPMLNHAVQVGPNEFVHGAGGLAELFNHSCDPNCAIRDYVEIFAARDIAAGEELVWDYRCTENSNWVLDPCGCGSTSCSGRVEGFDSLEDAVRTRYLNAGWVSQWIVDALKSGHQDT